MISGRHPLEMVLTSCRHTVAINESGELIVVVERRDLTGRSMRAPRGSQFSRPHERPIAVDGVVPLLHAKGLVEVQRAHSVQRRRPQFPVTPAPNCSPEGRTIVEFLNQTAIGLIRYDRRLKTAAADMIAGLALAAPEAKIVVHVASRQQTRDLVRELRAVSIAAAAGDSPQAETAQVVYGTFGQLVDIQREPNQPRIDVVPNWKVALHARQHDQWLLDSDITRHLIFAPLGNQFAPAEEDELRALVGFREFRVTVAGKLPVDIGWAVIAHRQRWAEGGEFRELFWGNEHRNNRIAGVARALAARGHHHSVELGPAAASFLSVHRNAPRVAVVVAQPEHGRELAVRLRVPCESGPGEQPVPPPQRSRSRPELRVVTSDRLLNLAVGEIDILIWAAGCRSLPKFDDAWWSTAADQPHRILWLDLSDDGRRDLASWARQRIVSLRRWGGYPAGWDAAEDRCMCWWESRIEGRSR